MQKIQLIIPVFEDSPSLERLLPDLLKYEWEPKEILVVDASEKAPFPSDNRFNVPVLYPEKSTRGRAKQMNFGADQTSSDILLFLHSDTFLPQNAKENIIQVTNKGVIFGGFSRKFDTPSPFLSWTCMLADLRGKHLGWFFGDQAIFVTRKAFENTGGFPDIYPFEDLALSRKLKAIGPYDLLRPGVLSSARRFDQEGPFLRTIKDLGLTLRYLLISAFKKST